MLAEQILKVTDKKIKIILEDGTSFVLYSGEVRRYHIHEGEEIPDDVLARIREEVLTKRAKLRCMNLLKSSDRTVRQLSDRLRRDGYPEDIIGAALDYVASYHYTDDRRYAENYIRSASGKKSRKEITLQLRKKGVSGELIEEAFLGLSQEAAESGLAEEAGDAGAIRKLIEKRHFDAGSASYEEKQKLLAYLMRKGFSMGDVLDVLGSLPSDCLDRDV